MANEPEKKSGVLGVSVDLKETDAYALYLDIKEHLVIVEMLVDDLAWKKGDRFELQKACNEHMGEVSAAAWEMMKLTVKEKVEA